MKATIRNLLFLISGSLPFCSNSQTTLGGVNLGHLTDYLFVFTNGSTDANWQGATKGFIGDVAVNGVLATERTSGTVPYEGTILTNDATLGAWQSIVNQNTPNAIGLYNNTARIANLTGDFNSALAQLKALAATPGFSSVSSASLNGLNKQNGIPEIIVINITSGLSVSSKITITGDAGDVFILRWDDDGNLANGYQGQTKMQSGGAIVPAGGLLPSNFIHVAGDIGSSGGGTTPSAPYPQGPRSNNGTGNLISGGSDFSGGGFFTGYWLTTGNPSTGQTSSLSNAIFVGGWYTSTTRFSMTSGTSGVYVAPPLAKLGDRVWLDVNQNGKQNAGEPGISNIPVYLKNGLGVIVDTATTDLNGLYLFDNLPSDNYTIVFPIALSGLGLTQQGLDPLDTTSSKASPLTGNTNTITMLPMQANKTLDAGFKPTVLPVKLVSFNAAYNKNNQEASLLWRIENDADLERFELERSTDGRNFNVRGLILPAAGNALSYQYNDQLSSVSDNIVYYRLAMIEKSGAVTYSRIASIRRDVVKEENDRLQLAPNPAMASSAVRFKSASAGTAIVSLTDLTGREMLKFSSRVTEGVNAIQLTNLGDFKRGFYMVQVLLNGKLMSSKLVIQ